MKEKSEYEEFHLQTERIRKILEEAIFKLQLLRHIPEMIEDNGKMLRKFLDKTESDFIVIVCKNNLLDRNELDNREDLLFINNMLERTIQNSAMKSTKTIMSTDSYEIHMAYALEILMKCRPLLDHVDTLHVGKKNLLLNTFIEVMVKLKDIVDERLTTSAIEEIRRENDLKTAYRSSMMLSDNIQEVEEQLEKQRQELGKENDRKEAILDDLSKKITALKEKTKMDVEKIIYKSEIAMMKDYNKSIELQEELSEMATETTQQYEQLLEEHLDKEKVLRNKRMKIEAQLASWVAKYDTDIGDKQTEYEELEKTLNEQKDEYEALEEKFAEQEREYVVLMGEKEAEEQRIQEEKAWIYLQNRAARRIQRYWRAYRVRKLARKKGKKGKKKGSADKKKEEKTTLKAGPDPNAILEKKFNSELLADIQQADAFEQKAANVDLMKD